MDILINNKQDLKDNAEQIFIETLQNIFNFKENIIFSMKELSDITTFIKENKIFSIKNFKVEFLGSHTRNGEVADYYIIYKITDTISNISGTFKIGGFLSGIGTISFSSPKEVKGVKKEITVYKYI